MTYFEKETFITTYSKDFFIILYTQKFFIMVMYLTYVFKLQRQKFIINVTYTCIYNFKIRDNYGLNNCFSDSKLDYNII